MQAEILHIRHCPSWRAISEDLRVALEATGHETTTIDFTLVRIAKEPARPTSMLEYAA